MVGSILIPISNGPELYARPAELRSLYFDQVFITNSAALWSYNSCYVQICLYPVGF